MSKQLKERGFMAEIVRVAPAHTGVQQCTAMSRKHQRQCIARACEGTPYCKVHKGLALRGRRRRTSATPGQDVIEAQLHAQSERVQCRRCSAWCEPMALVEYDADRYCVPCGLWVAEHDDR